LDWATSCGDEARSSTNFVGSDSELDHHYKWALRLIWMHHKKYKIREKLMAASGRSRQANTPLEPSKKSDGRVSFPHRMSLDLTPAQYEWLKEAAWQNRQSASGLLRLIIDQLMADPSQLNAIVKK
jgi:hypothetical protein